LARSNARLTGSYSEARSDARVTRSDQGWREA